MPTAYDPLLGLRHFLAGLLSRILNGMKEKSRVAIWCMAFLLHLPLCVNAAAQGSMPDRVPLFTLEDLTGNQVRLEDYRGMVVMINFWATWCAPCVEELPTMEALQTSWSEKPFEIIAINLAEDREIVSRFIDRLGIKFSFPIVLDPGGVVADTYKVRGLPATLLVDKNGLFAFGGVGERDWNSEAVRQEILPLFE